MTTGQDIFVLQIGKIINPYFREIVHKLNRSKDFASALLACEAQNVATPNGKKQFKKFENLFLKSVPQVPELVCNKFSFTIPNLHTGQYARFFKSDTVYRDRLQTLFHYRQWLKSIRVFFNQHYPVLNFGRQAEKCRMIVLGSCGVKSYNKALAFVRESDEQQRNYIPRAVTKFINTINRATNNGPLQTPDYQCTAAKKHVLFINATMALSNDQHLNAFCTAALVDTILGYEALQGRKVLLIDMRVPAHVHPDNLSDRIAQDKKKKEMKAQKKRCDKLYRLDDRQCHWIVRLGNLGWRCYRAHSDENYVQRKLEQIHKQEYPIAALYRDDCN